MRNGPQEKLGERLRAFAANLASGVIDAAFVTLWLVTNAALDWVVHQFQVSGTSAALLAAFQVLFGVSTLVPILVYVVVDVVRIVAWAVRAIGAIIRGTGA